MSIISGNVFKTLHCTTVKNKYDVNLVYMDYGAHRICDIKSDKYVEPSVFRAFTERTQNLYLPMCIISVLFFSDIQNITQNCRKFCEMSLP